MLTATEDSRVDESLAERKPTVFPDGIASSSYVDALCGVAEKMIGVSVAEVSFPAGQHRASFRATLSDGRSVIITRREQQSRAVLEERVLSILNAHGAPVPQVLGFNGLVLVQSDEGSLRLSEHLHRPETNFESTLFEAARSLLTIHKAAAAANLTPCVPILGADGEWIRTLIDRASVIGSHLDIPAPVPDLDGIFNTLMLIDPSFVKWDARPANAVMGENGLPNWIDWEHCGARSPLDDLVWLFCDENICEDESRDQRLIAEFAPRFSNTLSAVSSEHYIRVMGVFHFAVRLCLILSRADRHSWKDRESCSQGDKVGASLEQAGTVCRRAATWSDKSPMTKALSPWFMHLSDQFA